MRTTRRKSTLRYRRKTMHKRGGRQQSSHRSPSPRPNPVIVIDDDDLVAIERWNFTVTCMNGEQHTSPHEYTLIGARNAARDYCRTRGGMNGRAIYTRMTLR